MFRLLLILVLFLYGCGKKELPTTVSTPALSYSDNGIQHFSDGISIGDEQNQIVIRIIKSDGESHGQLVFYNYDSMLGILGSDGRAGFLRICDRLSSAEIYIGYRSIMLVDSKGNHGIELSNDGVLRINGNQVVGAQQPAIANSDGSQADNARAINEILETLRNHGSIARGDQIALSEN